MMAKTAPYRLATGTVFDGGLKVTCKNCWWFIGPSVLFFFVQIIIT
jgi:hypothetical protein